MDLERNFFLKIFLLEKRNGHWNHFYFLETKFFRGLFNLVFYSIVI